MRNELFGDDHDYAKYDLLIEVMEKTPQLNILTSVVMLTPDGNVQQGGRTEYEPGFRRSKLYNFLQDCLNGSNQRFRAVNELKHILNDYSDYRPYCDSPPHYFSDKTRRNYFSGVPDADLDSALVFIDPDTGIERPNAGNVPNLDEYLRWDDLENLFSRATNPSIFAVYQHYNFQATKQQKAAILNEKASNLIRRLEVLCIIAISTDYTTMFIFSRSSRRIEHLSGLLMAYAAMHTLKYQLVFP